MAKIDRKDILHVARLSRLSVRDEDCEKLLKEFNDILGYIENLNRLDTSKIEPTFQVSDSGRENKKGNKGTPMDADQPEASLKPADALKNASSKQENFSWCPKSSKTTKGNVSNAKQILESSLLELRQRLDQGEVSSQELARTFFEQIEKQDEKLNAFTHQAKDSAMIEAEAADKRIKAKDQIEPLTGIPVAIKDVISVRGLPTTAGSKILEKFIPPKDAHVTERLRKAGAVFLGKTNCDEFAMGSSNENSAYGPVRNPWNSQLVPGGSSGGSAASVAARETPAALGTDTGGSIRQPAALCGVVGLKPTYGRVSRSGVVAFASSLDQVGPMTKRVEDAAVLYEAIAGHDRKDSTSANRPVHSTLSELKTGIKGMKIGIPKEFLPKELAKDVRSNFDESTKKLEELGAKIEEISLPHTEYGIACYYIIAPAEASANLARYDGVRYTRRSDQAKNLDDLYTFSRSEGFGPEVRRRIMLGTFVLSSGYYDAYYLKGQKVRTLLRQDFEKAFEKVDLIACPTSPSPAFELESKSQDPLQMYLNDVFTVTVSLAGLPGISVPSGFTPDNLPLGLQFIGKAFDEAGLLRAAQAFEEETRHYERSPVA